MNVKEDVREIFSSVPWRAMFVLTLFIFITLAMWGSAMSFYFQNYVDQKALFEFLDGLGLVSTQGVSNGFGSSILNAFSLIAHKQEDAYAIGFSLFNMVGAIIQFFGVICLSRYLAGKYGKKQTFIVCLSLTTLFTALFYLPTSNDIGFMFILCILKSLAYAPTVPLLWAMFADVADHIEYVNHRRATGFCFAGVVFALKAGLGIGGAFAGIILSGFGYVSGSVLVQSASAVQGIRLVASIFPAILFFIGVIALFFYPITKKFNENMQAELAARRKNKQ
jgi:Na+/melibiose symporter-like transporter